MTTKRWMARQGDVLIERVAEIPAEAKAQADIRGRVILAYGEVTGHAHSLAATDAVRFGPSEDAFWLRVDKATDVTHQEHAAITLAPGNYRVRRQREYSAAGERRVAD